MALLPHDIDDLALAPVVLGIDQRLAELGALAPHALLMRVAVESDRPDWTREQRESGLLTTVGRFIELHGWALSWDARGLRVAHGGHSVVLGVPASLTAYIEGS